MADPAAGRLLREIVGGQKGRTAALVLVIAAGAGAELALPFLLGRAVDQALEAVRDGSAYVLGGRAALACVAAVGVLAVCDVLDALLSGTSTAVATARLRHRMLGHLLAAGPRLTRRFPEGDLVGRIVGNATDAGVTPSAAAAAVAGILPPLGGLVALTLIDPWLTVTFAAGVPALVLLLRVFVRDTSEVTGAYLAVQGGIAARLVDALAGIRTIAAAHAQEREARRVLDRLPDLRAWGYRMWRVQAKVSGGATLLVPLLQAAVFAVAGFALASGRLTPGDLLATGRYTVLAVGAGPVIAQIGRLARARAAASRAAELLAVAAPEYGSRTLPPGPGRLEFRDVSVEGVLHHVTLAIPGGSCTALVGASGAGKSTLAALAGRLTDPEMPPQNIPPPSQGVGHPIFNFFTLSRAGGSPDPRSVDNHEPRTSGRILLDGVPLESLSRDALRAAVTYAFARPALLGDTPADTITYGLDDPSGAAAAARAAAADTFVERLPDGYDTPMDDVPLSGGEAQRLGLARAFARAGRVLVLDDATSSLDTVTERRVTDVLTGALADRTRLIVARRAATAERADLVVWLDAGRVRGVGPHRELWADPAYQDVFGASLPVPEVAR